MDRYIYLNFKLQRQEKKKKKKKKEGERRRDTIASTNS